MNLGRYHQKKPLGTEAGGVISVYVTAHLKFTMIKTIKRQYFKNAQIQSTTGVESPHKFNTAIPSALLHIQISRRSDKTTS